MPDYWHGTESVDERNERKEYMLRVRVAICMTTLAKEASEGPTCLMTK